MPYEDSRLSVVPDDILSHTYDEMEFKTDREGYQFVTVGIDWGKKKDCPLI